MAADATPRQFEIAKCAVNGPFGSASDLAQQVYLFNLRMIREDKSSAFRMKRDDEDLPITPSTIVSYVSFAKKIGIIDSNHKTIKGIDENTKLGPFNIILKQKIEAYCKDNSIWISDISTRIKNEISKSEKSGETICVLTKDYIRSAMASRVSAFDFNQAMKILSEQFSDRVMYGSQNIVLERQSLWLR